MTKDFVIADAGLAEWGRREVSIAENEMPGLMALRDEYRGKQPPKRCPYCRLPAYDYSDCGSYRNTS